MANGRTRRIRRKIDTWAVYDALPAPIRAALQEGPQQWDAVAIRQRLRKLAGDMPLAQAVAQTVKLIEWAHANDIREAYAWQPRKNVVKAQRIPSPHILANATMQTSGRTFL